MDAVAIRSDFGAQEEEGTLSLERNVAAAAKSHQLCPTLCDPTDGSPPGS